MLLSGVLAASGTPAWAQSSNEVHATGLKPPTQEEFDRLRKQGQEVRQVLPNRIALERMNEHRRARGLRTLDTSATVAVGQETLGTGERAPGGVATFTASALPTHVDNSTLDFFPPIRSQGSIGSCVAWATTYYQLSHTVALQYGWDAKHNTDNSRLFSPKWTYNFINSGVDQGSYITSAYGLLGNQGAATWASIPYDSNYTSWPLDPAVWRGALTFRTKPVQYISSVSSADGLQRVRELLANGYVLVYGTYVNSWQATTLKNDPATPNDDAYAGKSVYYWLNGTNGSHAMTIVGYDDEVWTDINKNNVVDPGEKGALRIANSWGTGWNEAGFTWLAYDALRSVSAVAGGPSTGRIPAFHGDMVYHVTVRPSYTPKLLAEVTLNHARRNQINLSLGLSDVSTSVPAGSEGGGTGGNGGTPKPVWNITSLWLAGGPRAFNGSTTSAVDGTFVFDFTDIAPSTLEAKRFLVRLGDNTVGDSATLKAFRLVDLTNGGTTVSSMDAPLSVDATTGEAHIDYSLTNHPPVITSASPAGRVKLGPGGSVPLQVEATDADGHPLSFSWTVDGAPVEGNTSSLLYTPVAVGPHSVRVAVSDGLGGVVFQHWNVALNARPLANSQSITLTEDSSKSIPLTAFDADGDALSLRLVDPPAHGSLTGSLPSPLYLPEANYAGPDSFTFQANDGMEDSPLAAITLTVTPVNDAPSVRITSPAHGSSFAAPARVAFEVAASDVEGPIARVELYQGSTKVGEVTSAPFSFALEGLAAGSYGFSAKAYDSAGLVSSSTSITVNVLAPTLSVSASDSTAAEPGSDTGRFVISRSGGVSGQVLTVQYTLSGTAANGVDFVSLPGSVTLGAGVTSVNLDVSPIDDAAIEGKETVVLTLSPDPTYKLGTTVSGTVALLDNELPVVTLSASDGLASEPGAADTAKLTVTRTGATTSALTVRYALGGTATAGADYADLPGSVTIPAGAASASIVITALDDALTEGKETLVVTLQEDSTYQLHTSTSATVSLLDDELPVVTVTASDAEAAEPANPGAFTVTRTGPTTAPLTVLLTVGGTAAATSDYQALATSLVIPEGAASAQVNVQPVDDELVEGKEAVTVTLAADAAYQLATSTSATVNLFDDEKPELRITAVDASASEAGSNGGLYSVKAIPAPKVDLSIAFTVSGTASQGTDYAALASPLLLPAGTASVDLPLTPIDDTVKEGSETVVVTLPATTSYSVGTASATVTIADND
ncbi:hypothetical protein DAT35_37685 [Vitiosangium sp. GDMCC 1.1324]|nr:hypothetical protein DAT35_37685 [Vitiosangium sp. GDMCC 1.1324]